jgi:hypothetical protein
VDGWFAPAAEEDGGQQRPGGGAPDTSTGGYPVQDLAGDSVPGDADADGEQLAFSWPGFQAGAGGGFSGWGGGQADAPPDPASGEEEPAFPAGAPRRAGRPDVAEDFEPAPLREQAGMFQAPSPRGTSPEPGSAAGSPGQRDPYSWQAADMRRRPPAEPRRRGSRRHGLRVAVPAIAIGGVAAFGAALLVDGNLSHAAARLPAAMSTASGSPAAAGPVVKKTAAAAQTGGTFPGYPGRQGSVQVNSVATDGAVEVAVGSADGHAALWRRDGSGSWTLLRNRPALPESTIMTSVAHGSAGWLAVGNLSSTGQQSTANLASTGQQPAVLTSKDGVTWQSAPGGAFTGPGFTVNAAAANSSFGYVIVGEQLKNGVPVDAMWFTSDLVNWTRGGDTIASTVSSISSGMTDSKIFAVTATPGGWVAAGSHNGCHTAWVTSDGRHWLSYDIPKPGGSQDPLLSHVAAVGNTVVAAGDLGVHGGRIPLIVVSADGGVHWQGTAIGGSGAFAGPQGTVTALTTVGTGFIAAGLEGPPGAQHAVTWTSPDGITWSAAVPAGTGTQEITVLASSGASVTRISSVTSPGGGTGSVEATAPATA